MPMSGLCSTDGREQLIAKDQIDERHGLLAQRMDDVMVVDDMAMLAAPLRRPAAPQGQQSRGAEEAVEPVIIEVDMEPVADQARGNAIEDAAEDEAATRGDEHASFLVVGRSSRGEWLERGAFDLDALAVPGIAPADNFVDEAANRQRGPRHNGIRTDRVTGRQRCRADFSCTCF